MFKLEEITVKEIDITRDDAVAMFGETAVTLYEEQLSTGRTPRPLKFIAEKSKIKTKTIYYQV